MYLLIDNYDSFTYNLYQAFTKNGIEIIVKRNDSVTIREIERLSPEKIIISPGPGTPLSAGVSNAMVRELGGKVPILGICLGHQCIVSAFGGRITRVDTPVHGKASRIRHIKKGIFNGVSDPFYGARYHSLEATCIPPCLEITAWTEEGAVMAVEHRNHAIIGLQFHPESFMTPEGNKIIDNFVKMRGTA